WHEDLIASERVGGHINSAGADSDAWDSQASEAVAHLTGDKGWLRCQRDIGGHAAVSRYSDVLRRAALVAVGRCDQRLATGWDTDDRIIAAGIGRCRAAVIQHRRAGNRVVAGAINDFAVNRARWIERNIERGGLPADHFLGLADGRIAGFCDRDQLITGK